MKQTAGTLMAVAIVLQLFVPHAGADDWPVWRGKGRLGVWSETGIIERFPQKGLAYAWRVPIHGGYAGPAVAGGRVFVTDFQRGDGNRGTERVLALDATTGEILWAREWPVDYTGLMASYAVGPRATPTVDDDRVYVLGAMGALDCLRSDSGAIVWNKDFIKKYGTEVPVRGMVGAPLVERDLLIALVGGEPDAKVVAFNKRTGKEVWRALSSDWEPGYNPPVVIEAAGRRQVIIWHPKAVTAGLHALITTPVLDGGQVYGICSYGQFRALDAGTGERLWGSMEPVAEETRWAAGLIVRNGERYFINNDRGDLIIVELAREGCREISRTKLIAPTSPAGKRRELGSVHWSHPAYANRHIVVRNDEEIVRAYLGKAAR